MFYPSFYFDPTYILIIIGVIICSIASMRVKSTFSKIFRNEKPYGADRSAGGRTCTPWGRNL